MARLFSKFEAAFDLNFSFRTCSQLENSNRATARLDVDVTSKLAGSWHQLTYVYGVQVNAWEMDVRLEQKRLLVYAKCLLLANLFSDHFTTFTVKLDFMLPKTQFAEFSERADLIIPLRIKQQPCFTSMLESLLADGYDLAALQPFLVV